MLFEQILLNCYAKINQERSIAAIYYLFQGRKSVQTIQDANLYQIHHFYGIYPHLSKATFDHTVIRLTKHGFLQRIEKDNKYHYIITYYGKSWLRDNDLVTEDHHFRGLMFHSIDSIFTKRLLLLIQVWTNSKMQHTSYIPVIDDNEVERWIKVFYRENKNNINEGLTSLYKELCLLLADVSEREANIFIDRFTGYRQYGMSIEQLSNMYHISIHDIHLLLVGVVHFILDKVISKPANYSLLYRLIKDIYPIRPISTSTLRTYSLLNEQYSISEIAKIRRLKENTIQDHIVEIALYDDMFSIEPYVTKQIKKEIVQAVLKTNSFKLKTIKSIVGDQVSYFQIRLVLTTMNRMNN